MNEENNWDQVTNTDKVEGPVEEIFHSEIINTNEAMKTGKAAGSSKVNVEIIAVSGQVCQKVLNGKDMPDDWITFVMVTIYKGKGVVLNCGSYREVKLFEHSMKFVGKKDYDR